MFIQTVKVNKNVFGISSYCIKVAAYRLISHSCYGIQEILQGYRKMLKCPGYHPGRVFSFLSIIYSAKSATNTV